MRDPSGSYTIDRTVEPPVQTRCVSDDELARESGARSANREAWQAIIDKNLVEWGRNPELFDVSEIVPPSADILAAACHIAMRMRDEGFAAPSRVVPDGDGGVAFERRGGEEFESLEIASDGRIELLKFHNSILVARHPWPSVPEWTR